MDRSATSRAVLRPLGVREELLIAGVAVSLTIAAMLSPMALPLAVSGVVFVLAALRFKPLLLFVVFFLPLTPFLDWNFPIRDLSTLVRFSMFAGAVVYRVSHRERLRGWLWSGWLTRAVLGYFTIAVASAVFFNPVTLDAQRELMRLASYICFYFVITDWIKTQQESQALLKALMVSTIAVALFGFYQAIIGGYSGLYDVLYPVQEEMLSIPPWEGRVTSFLEHYNGLAGYINLVMPLCAVCALRVADKGMRRLSWWFLAFAGAALLLTQSRGGLLACAAMMVAGACFFAPDRTSRARRIAVVMVACVIAAAVAGFFFQRLADIDDSTAVSRLAIWGAAFSVFARAPVLGMGFGNLRMTLGGLLGLPESWAGDAHNLYLELLAETGIVGLVLFLFLIVVALRMALRQYRNAQDEWSKAIAVAVLAAIIGVLVHGMVDYLFHTTPQAAALVFCLLGLLGAAERRDL